MIHFSGAFINNCGGMTIFQLVALLAMLLFYGLYFQRQFALRRRGIRTARLARGDKAPRVRRIELGLIGVTAAMPLLQVLSIVWGRFHAPLVLMPVGALLAFSGVGFFAAAVFSMRENWRAGIDRSQQTELVTHGVYRLSRNPAFVGFGLFYVGVAAMFPHPVLLVCVAAALVLFHLQVLEEERFMRARFGEPYLRYTRRTRRYL